MTCIEPAILTRGLTKTYRGVWALKALDLKVPRNSICGFLGPNGAGKSTTIKLLLGLMRPSAGTGRVLDYDIVAESLALRRRVGYLAQDPRFYDYMTARETLHFAARFFYSGPGPAIARRVDESLELAGLAGKADRPVGGFSGGERQRLGIAQAQINHPDLLILDEPAAALDPQGRRDVLDIMARLRGSTTIFYSTHILDDVQRVSDTAIILDRGRLVAQGPVQELLAGGAREAVYQLTLSGNTDEVRARVAALPWVSELTEWPASGHSRWQVTVSDPAAADARLLRTVLADEHCTVTEFGRRRYNLEEIFLSLTGGNPQ